MKNSIIYSLLLIIAVLSGCGIKKEAKPNLLLITLDTTRADHLGCYGYEKAQTPHIDAMAAKGVLFERAYCNVPLTLPSHATIMTGLLPPEHGLHINGEKTLDDQFITLAEVLAEKGWNTAAFVASFVLDSRFGLNQGFDLYNDDITHGDSENFGLRAYKDGSLIVDSVIEWSKMADHEPYFCWVHLFDPHKPYHTHTNLFGEQYINNPYDAEITYMDMQLGRLLKALERDERLDNTWIIIVADHGESLGEHNELYHGNTLYNGVLNVPLIVHSTNAEKRNHRVRKPVSLEQLYPTILELIGIDHKNRVAAKSFAPSILNKKEPPKHHVYSETEEPMTQYGWHPLKSIIADQMKFVDSRQDELYDIIHDPKESQNLIDNSAKMTESFELLLNRKLQSMQKHTAKGVVLTQTEKRTLDSLGYTGGSVIRYEINEFDTLPDVKDMLPLLNEMMRSKYILKQGRLKEALEIRQNVVKQNPGNISFQFLLAEAHYRKGDAVQTVNTLTNMLSTSLQKVPTIVLIDSLTLLGSCYYILDAKDKAEEHLLEALALDPKQMVALNGLSWIYATKADATEAEKIEALRSAKEAVKMTARKNPSYLDTLAAAYAANKQFDIAVKTVEEAMTLTENPALMQQLKLRGDQYRQSKRYIEE